MHKGTGDFWMNEAPASGRKLDEVFRPDLIKIAAAAFTMNTSRKMLYEESIELIELVESRLAKKTRRLPGFLHKGVKVPLWLALRGLESILAESTRTFVVLVGLVFLSAWVTGFLPPEYRRISENLWLLAISITAFLLIFPAPSTYCSVGINGKHVVTVAEKFSAWEERSARQVELIAKNVKLFEERAQRRLTIFRWVLAAAWASVSPFTGELIKAVTAVPPRSIDIAPLLPSLEILAFCFLCVETYARGVDIVFRSIELGCNETVSSIHKNERNGTYPILPAKKT